MTEQQEHPDWIDAIWSAPSSVRAGITTRVSGASEGPFHALNLGTHVEDNPQHVTRNRQQLRDDHSLPAEPIWLDQVHGTDVINFDSAHSDVHRADGIYTTQSNVVLAIMTADCLPILISDAHGREIAALHCGWRGLAGGILQKALPLFAADREALRVWMGPAISARHYEIDQTVKDQFAHLDGILEKDTFIPTLPGHYLVSLYRIAMLILKSEGVERIYGGQYCTYRDDALFYSYRRDKGKTGRMASLIWIDPTAEKEDVDHDDA